MDKPIRFLHLEDNPHDAELVRDRLESDGLACDVIVAADRRSFESAVDAGKWDIIICDYNVPGYDGLSALRCAQERWPHTPVIVLSGELGPEEALECIRAGATDYLLKQRAERLPTAVRRAIERARAQEARIAAEVARRDSDARMRAIVENLGEGLLITDAEDRILFANPRISQILGYSNSELVGAIGHETIMPPGEQAATERRNAERHEGRSDEYETLLRTKDGRVIPVQVHATPLRDAAQKIIGTLGVISDISERKRTEAALEREKIFSDTVIQGVSGLFYVMDTDGVMIRTNDVVPALYNIPPEQIAGTSALSLIHEEDRALVGAKIAEVFATGHAEVETRLATPGGIRHALLTGRRMILDGAAYLVGSGLDITERKRTEAVLAESASRMKEQAMMLASVRDAVIVRALDHRVIYWNAGAERLYGWSAHEASGRPANRLLCRDSAAGFPMEEILRVGEWRGELRHVTKDGRDVVVESVCNLLSDESGRPAGVLSINSDITARKEIEAALAGSERFALASLDALAAHVAVLDECGIIIAANRAWRQFAVENSGDVAHLAEGVNYLDVCDRAAGQGDSEVARLAEGIRAVLRGETDEFVLEYPYHSSLEKRWFLCRITRFAWDGPVRVAVAHEDVTLVKLVQEQLHESEETFQSLARVVPCGIFRCDHHGRCTYVNWHWCVMSGITAEQAAGDGWSGVIHPDDRARVIGEWNEAVSTGSRSRSEFRFRQPDGNVVWVLGDAVALADADGRSLGYVGTIFNITAQKQTEAALRTLSTETAGLGEESFFELVVRRLAETAGAECGFVGQLDGERQDHIQTLAVWADGKLMPNFRYHLSGTPCENVVGKDLCIYPADVQRLFPRDARLVEMGVHSYGAIPLFDAAGRAQGLIGVMGRQPLRDPQHVESMLKLFAVRTAAEIERQRHTRRFTDLFEFAPDAIVMADHEGIIHLANRQAEHLFGWTGEELAGRQVEVLMPGAMRGGDAVTGDGAAPDSTGRSMTGGSRNLRALRKDGTGFPADISISPMESSEGRMVAVAARDVTERHRSEERIRASLREKEVLLKEVHHRVKNNLQVICSLLAMQSDAVSDPFARSLLVESQNRVRSMAMIHEKLYRSDNLSRIDFGEYVSTLTGFLFRSYSNAAGRVTLRLHTEDVQLNIDTAAPCGLVLNELVSNSLKHAFNDGRSGELRVELRAVPEGYELTVADDGPGLPGGFAPERTESLGMQLVDLLTKQLKATLTIQSEGGACFRLTFKELNYAARN